ncbi:hypothetical protein DPMN_184783 [Dreissena polymorpha]|uniref:Uncharacterized protein n=1 Tax=Dreissena polymorpha TaxID=45954 RepID=A0A9D4I7Q7_DREPO|nr:hypothetical protein DPMN_184783 [Dreissena polymorpha]
MTPISLGPTKPKIVPPGKLPPQRFLAGRRTAPSLFFNGRRTAPFTVFSGRRTALLLKNRGRRNPEKCPLNKEIARRPPAPLPAFAQMPGMAPAPLSIPGMPPINLPPFTTAMQSSEG